MALPYPIAASQTDAKSPVDDNLMDSIRLNLDYIYDIASNGGIATYVWNINGALRKISNGVAKRIDMQFLHASQTFSKLRIAQRKSGLAGITEIDIRYHSTPKTPITGIDAQFLDSTQSIAQLGSAVSTQAVSIATPAVATQSIARAKTSLSVTSIVMISTGYWRYNLSAAPDSDWRVGDTITTAACTAGGNNGTFTIIEVNQSGYPSIVVANASGVAQTGAAGTMDLGLWSYSLVNPANAHYVAGETAIFASHTTPANNGTFTIYAVNNGGNNIQIKSATGVAQAGVVGTITTTRWIYTFSAAAPARFVVGEKARFASHTSGVNNGDFTIVAVNYGAANNVVVTNAAGTAQAAAAGNMTSLRWKYSFSGDPSTNVSIGHTLVMASHTTGANNGTFTVVDINDTVANNIIIYNASGVAQAGVAGTVTHTRKKIKFSSDQSLIYSTDSYIEICDTPDANYMQADNVLPFKVYEVNRGGGANYNVVIECALGGAQSSPAGFICTEARSIFTAADGSKPQLSTELTGLTANGLLKAQYSGSSLTAAAIPDQTYLGLYILRVQTGDARDLSVMLS